jgi:chromosome segregation ATPase
MLTKVDRLEEEGLEKDETIQHLKLDIRDLDREITKKDGAIEFLQQLRQQTEDSTSSVQNQFHRHVKPLPDPEKFSGFKSTIPFD